MIYLYPSKDGSGNTAHVAILMVDKDNKPYWEYQLIEEEEE